MVKKIIALLFCLLWIGITFYRPMDLFQSLGSLLTYSTGVFSIHSPDEKPEHIELKSPHNHKLDIYIDSIGVPHIYGENAVAVTYGLGYMHARDRYFQMEVITRVVEGQLSGLLGDMALTSDVFWKPLETEAKAKEVLEEIKTENPAVYAQLLSYCEGINYYLENEPGDFRTPEYRMLGDVPRKWQPHYSIQLSWYMSYMLTYQDWHTNRQQALNKIPAGLLDSIFGTDKSNYPYIIQDTTFNIAWMNDTSYHPIAAGELVQKSETPEEKLQRKSIGSNNWAVGAGKTTTGSAFLCNDTHLDITLPNPWYEAHLVCPEYHVYGFSIPCSPFIISGYNENIAWGITNGQWDLIDRYLLKINPENKNEYWYEGAWKKMEQREYQITGKNSDTTFIQQFTASGLVIRDSVNAYAQKWYPAEKTKSVVAFSYLASAKGWDDFKQALSGYSYPPQNFAYADKKGNVGMISAGKLPLRNPGFQGGLLDGTRKHPERFVPFEQLPQSFNPAGNFVFSANQKTARTNYYINYDWPEPYRPERIREMLTLNKKLSLEDMKAIQADRTDIGSKDLARLIQKYKGSTAEWKLLEPLEKWNGITDVKSYEPLLYMYFNYFLQTNFRELIKSEYGVLEIPALNKIYANLFAKEEFHIGKTKIVSKDFILAAIKSTREMLQKDFGDEYVKANTSPLAYFDIQHLVRFPGLGATVNSEGGNANTPNVNVNRKHAPSMRSIINMSETPVAYTVLAGGQSGRPNSANFKNQLDAWNKVIYRQTQFLKKPEELKNIGSTIRFTAD